MVGHTHKDINQLLSCISRYLAEINVLTLLELITEIGQSYSSSIKVSLLTFMYDVKQWMEGFTDVSLSGHANQHQFKVLYGMIRSIYHHLRCPKLIMTNCFSSCHFLDTFS